MLIKYVKLQANYKHNLSYVFGRMLAILKETQIQRNYLVLLFPETW